MKRTLAALAALVVFSSSTSFGITPPEMNISVSALGKPLPSSSRFSARPTISTEMIRAGLRKSGIDPESPQGRRLSGFLAVYLNDPQGLKGIESLSDASFGPEARMRILQLMAASASGRASLCEATPGKKADIFEMARTLSPADFDARLTLLELMLHPSPAATQEHYSLEQRIDANARLNVVMLSELKSHSGESTPQQQLCSAFVAVVAELQKMPESFQRRASYEVFRVIQGKAAASATVVAAPQAYFDDVFDETRLPPVLRKRLPRDGKYPLPFKRIVLEGRWVSELPGESGPVRDVFVNRRNNGVIAEMIEATGTDSDNARAIYVLSYGFQNLRSQVVVKSGAYRLSQLGAFHGAMPQPDKMPSVPGETFRLTATEPLLNGDYLPFTQCEVGESLPASEIVPGLTGMAIRTQCTSPSREKGQPYMSHGVWLQDYGISVGLGWIVGGLVGSFVITKAVVE